MEGTAEQGKKKEIEGRNVLW